MKANHFAACMSCSQHHSSDIKEVIKPFDWSYTTDYCGTTLPRTHTTESLNAGAGRGPSFPFQQTDAQIPLHLLKRPDPILFYDDVTLYEDELADNGIALLSCKIRVMPARLLLLARFFLRLDDVIFRIRDTRVYVEFSTRQVMREYIEREEKYEHVRTRVMNSAFGREAEALAMMRDPNKLADLLPIVHSKTEELHIK
jgi:type 2A phosphatase activator TIP41